MLVQPGDYAHHLNQVVGVTTKSIIFLKRKFVSRSGHELMQYPVDSCASVQYFDERPLKTIISGVLLIALVGFVIYMLVVTWDQLEPGTRIWPGLLALAGIYGVRRAFGARRHRLVFKMKDRTKLAWASRPGEYDLQKPSADSVVEFARSRELLGTSRLVRTT